MSENLLYFNGLNVISNSLSYCVDMLRLSCNITYDVFERKIANREFILKDFIKSWFSTKICDFYYNYTYTDISNGFSFWFGFITNKEKCDGKRFVNPFTTFNFTIEFNPNKVKDCPFLLHILNLSTDWVVKQCDFAIDIPTNILNLCGFDKGRKDCFMTYDCGGANKTYYIGKKNNRVKIYNKSIESDLSFDLTRIEITKYFDSLNIRDINFYEFNGYFPELFLKNYQLSFSDFEDKTLSALVYAVVNGYPLHDLSRRYRDRVKEFLHKKKPIDIDFKCLNKCLSNYIYYYFPLK